VRLSSPDPALARALADPDERRRRFDVPELVRHMVSVLSACDRLSELQQHPLVTVTATPPEVEVEFGDGTAVALVRGRLADHRRHQLVIASVTCYELGAVK
jgi:hypothetical protein